MCGIHHSRHAQPFYNLDRSTNSLISKQIIIHVQLNARLIPRATSNKGDQSVRREGELNIGGKDEPTRA
jgi:hypothetical protein